MGNRATMYDRRKMKKWMMKLKFTHVRIIRSLIFLCWKLLRDLILLCRIGRLPNDLQCWLINDHETDHAPNS